MKQPKPLRKYVEMDDNDIEVYKIVERKTKPKRDPDIIIPETDIEFTYTIWIGSEWVSIPGYDHPKLAHLMECPRTGLLLALDNDDDYNNTSWTILNKRIQDAYLDWKTTQEFEEIILGAKSK
jgi:hypothetical protein